MHDPFEFALVLSATLVLLALVISWGHRRSAPPRPDRMREVPSRPVLSD